MDRQKVVVIAKLKPTYLLEHERFLPRLEFPKYLFDVRLPLDVPFDPNSIHGDPPNIGSESDRDLEESDNPPRWRNWRDSPPDREPEEKGGPMSWMKGKKNEKTKVTREHRASENKRKIRGACGGYIEEENGSLPIQLRYDGESGLNEVIFNPSSGNTIQPHKLSVANVLAICFSVTDLSVLEQLPHHWIPLIRHRCPILPIVLIACDVEKRMEHPCNDSQTHQDPTGTDSVKYITRNQGEKVGKEIGAKYYIECSRKTGENVELAYQAMAAALIHKEEIRGTKKGGDGRDEENGHTKITLSESDWERDVLSKRGKNGWFMISKLWNIRGDTE